MDARLSTARVFFPPERQLWHIIIVLYYSARTLTPLYPVMSCELDPIPSKLLIECLDSILPSLTDLFNSSLASGIFPQCLKSALVTPILKKRCLDHNDLKNYRPVSNLCFIAKILEKLVLSQVSSYLNSHNLYNTCQSAYRPGHSTETALLKVVDDLFLSLNKGNISVLALLDYSSAFDAIDHASVDHHGVQPTGCMDNNPEPSRGVPC